MGPTSSLLNPKPQTLTRATNRWRRTYTGTTLSSGRRTYLTTQGVTLVPRPALLVGPSHPGSVPSASSTTCTTTISDLPQQFCRSHITGPSPLRGSRKTPWNPLSNIELPLCLLNSRSLSHARVCVSLSFTHTHTRARASTFISRNVQHGFEDLTPV